MLVTLMTDASVCGQTGAAGYGFWVVSKRGGSPGQGQLKGRIKDSFEGELKAVAMALNKAINMQSIIQGDHIIIQLDNSGVVNCLNKVNKVRPNDTEVIEFIFNTLSLNNLTIEARHVKGHSSRKENRYTANKLCDMRAKIEMRKARKLHEN